MPARTYGQWAIGLPLLFLFGLLLWSLLAVGAVLIIVAFVAYLGVRQRRRRRRRVLGRSQELRLWSQLGQVTGLGISSKARVLLPLLSQYRGPAASGMTAAGVIEEARSVAGMFHALREDLILQHPEESLPEALTSRIGAPLPRRSSIRELAQTPAPAPQGPFASPMRPGDVPEREAPVGSPGFASLPVTGELELGGLGVGRPFDLLVHGETKFGVTGLTTEGVEGLSFRYRMDVVDRLYDDLQWAKPRREPRPRWMPAFLRRARAESEARDYARLSRLTDLARGLMLSAYPGLRKKGVELAIALEMELHESRARHPEHTH